MSQPLHIGLLLCHSFEDMLDSVGGLDYPELFRNNLLAFDAKLKFSDFHILQGQFPESVDECDVWLINGSPSGVYDDLEWIAKLKTFVQALELAKKPTIGICFGHQLLAEALGGKVTLSEKGLGIGLANNLVVEHAEFMQPSAKHIKLLGCHQDQVVKLPKGSKVLAASDFCPNYMVQFSPHMLGIQGHPEFTIKMIEAVITHDAYVDNATLANFDMETLKGKDDAGLVFEWMVNFYRQNQVQA